MDRASNRAPNTAHDILRAADVALDLPDRGERAAQLVGLLERADAGRGDPGDERGDFAYLIPLLEQRVSRAIEDLRTYLQGPEYADRPQVDVEGLAARLEALRRRRSGPQV
jgi:hypothetical protein